MILQALAAYHERISEECGSRRIPYGFQEKEIPFIVVIGEDGSFKGIEDTRSLVGKRRKARTFLVPREEVRSKNVKPNFLWDKPSYALGVAEDKMAQEDPEKAKRMAQEHHTAFKEMVGTVAKRFPSNRAFSALQTFLSGSVPSAVERDANFPEIRRSGGNVGFRIEGRDELITSDPDVKRYIDESNRQSLSSITSQCLVTGRVAPARDTHAKIKGVWKAQTSGACIVSFNLGAFLSFGKEQGHNAPVSAEAEFAYTTALNSLLQSDSGHRFQVGDATAVCWAAKKHVAESWMVDLFGEPPDKEAPDRLDKEAPDRRVEAVKALFAAPCTGALPITEDPTPFYVLGLSPNASRIAIRFWHAGTVGEIAGAIRQHFEDIEIAPGPKGLSLFRLLVSTATQGKAENIQPNLAGAFMKAILEGTPYPRTLLMAALRRARAERDLPYPRAALIKAVLVRDARREDRKEVGMTLNREYDNIGYLLGRLFAVYERCQEGALGGTNVTIRDRFFGSASTTPIVAFSYLARLNRHHLAKLRQKEPGRAVNLEKEIGGILDRIPESGYPSTLAIDDQGRFAIGYYHQRQDFFKDRPESAEEKNS